MARFASFIGIVIILALLLTTAGCTSDTASKATVTVKATENPTPEITVNATQALANSIAAQLASVKSTSPIWLEAYRIFGSMKKTEYIHTTHIDEAKGIYEFDCLGFVDYVLSNSVPTAYEAATHGYEKPAIAQYAGYFKKLDTKIPNAAGWTKVAYPIDLKPGDVCLWLKPSTLDKGHMWIIAGMPMANPNRNGEVLVRILDSDGVHSDDSRADLPYKYGLGTGVMGYMVDGEGNPIGLYWQGGVSSDPGELDTTIVCGRANT